MRFIGSGSGIGIGIWVRVGFMCERQDGYDFGTGSEVVTGAVVNVYCVLDKIHI